MWAGSLGINRRTRYLVTIFTAAFFVLYTILAFSAVRFTSVNKKSNCNYDEYLSQKAEDILSKAVKALLAPASVGAISYGDVNNGVSVTQQLSYDVNKTSNVTANVTTLPIKIGGFLEINREKGVIVLQNIFKIPNETKGLQPKKVWRKKSKFGHVFKPLPGEHKPLSVDKREGLQTRFGFLAVSSIEDHAFLTQDEVQKLSKFFMYDDFSKNGTIKSKHDVLTFENRNQRYTNWTNGQRQNMVTRPLCPKSPPGLKGKVSLAFRDLSPPTLLDIQIANPKVKQGGRFTPDCHPRSKIAIIVPFRGRDFQLQVLLAHMHPIWQRQQIDYTVYTVSQLDDGTIFNKAKVMNIGFLEARKHDTYDCYVFHDVDMTLEDDRCLYQCPDSDDARELSVYLDKFDYQELKYRLNCKPKSYPQWIYAKYFGGVAMMTEKQILDVNGYSNLYWGWGSEDIDMYLRLWQRGYGINQPYGRSCTYHMMKHETETSNRQNNGRFALLGNCFNRMRYEGLTSIRYKVLDIERLPLYTNITVEVGRPKEPLVDFMSLQYPTFQEQCDAVLPWQ